MTSSTAFLDSGILIPSGRSSRARFRRRQPVCVLDERRFVSPPPTAVPSTVPDSSRSARPKSNQSTRYAPLAVPLPEGAPPANYRVLPADLPEDELPPPPPVHYTVPVIGYMLDLMLPAEVKRSRTRKFNGVYTSKGLLRRMHFVTDYNAIASMMRDVSVFRNSGSSEIMIALFGDDNMLNLDGVPHQEFRGTLNHAFSPKIFPFYHDIIRRRVDDLWETFSKTTSTNGRGLADPAIREAYLAATVEMVNGLSKDSEFFKDIRERFTRFQRALLSPTFGPVWDDALRARDELLKMTEDVVRRSLVEDAEKIERLRAYGDKLSYLGAKDIIKGDVCIMDISIANSSLKTGPDAESDPELIRFQARVFLGLWFAGFATSAATTSCAVFEMGMNPDIWKQLAEEQDAIVANVGGDRTVTYDQLAQMPLLESFISEMLRMKPAAIGVVRKVAQDFEVFGRRIEEGSFVFFEFAEAMMDERYYPEPEKAKVDRFVRKPGQEPAPRVLTFGAPGSPHYCLGWALAGVLMKTTLGTLLRGYTIEMDGTQSRKYNRLPENVPSDKVVVSRLKPRGREA